MLCGCVCRRWAVRYVIPAKVSKRSRKDLELPVLRRANALGEEGFRNLWPSTVPPPMSLSRPNDKPVNVDNNLKKRKSEEEPNPHEAQRVSIVFPPMQAPFGGPKKFDQTKNTATLTLSLRNEENDPELQDLRKVLTGAEDVLGELIKLIDPKFEEHDPISAEHKNTLIRPGKPASEGALERWPDTIPLKLYPSDVRFKDVDGKVLETACISFLEYDVQPTVELRDIWKVGMTYYPRLVITECVLHARAAPKLIMLSGAKKSKKRVKKKNFEPEGCGFSQDPMSLREDL